jgi:hypothetical protein
MLSAGILIEAERAKELTGVNDVTASDIPLQGVIQGDILTAVAAGLYTTTASMSGYSSIQVQALMDALRSLGYVISYSGTTLTIKWS